MTPIYIIAAEIEQHPARLGQMLRGKLPMSAEIAQRLQEVIKRHAAG